jgi:hypothetical protein
MFKFGAGLPSALSFVLTVTQAFGEDVKFLVDSPNIFAAGQPAEIAEMLKRLEDSRPSSLPDELKEWRAFVAEKDGQTMELILMGCPECAEVPKKPEPLPIPCGSTNNIWSDWFKSVEPSNKMQGFYMSATTSDLSGRLLASNTTTAAPMILMMPNELTLDQSFVATLKGLTSCADCLEVEPTPDPLPIPECPK